MAHMLSRKCDKAL